MVDKSWMHSSDPQLKQKNAEWHAQTSSRKQVAQHSHGALKVMHFMFFNQQGLVLDQPTPIGKMVNGQHYCALLQYKVRPALHCQQPALFEHDVTLSHEISTPHYHHDVQNVVQCWGWEVLAYPPYSPNLAPCDSWLFAHVKEQLWSK
jgi:hypothetical protein